ncbi:agamous-like MADS-box protein MADS2 isoform X2 [Cornus florida]|uniref:agamous-like MADS-box protein MADS2 isoform X2 n=1 Tax=Cornus florida TaxID=4283 RepID=UPI0028968083|nr:agamous-like MADS-box protein MADS2 isoform X2 [Cornus florida]
MGRGRVELKRIENKINRQVTFAKRRNGLLKKAYELSVLCDAEVALIIFSNRGKLYDFCSNSSMARTLERYQRSTYSARAPSQADKDTQSSYQEYLKLKARVEVLQQSERHFLGDDLGELSSNDLEQLEGQLDTSLKQIRSTKTQFMLNQVSNLEQKEQRLLEVNRVLRKQLEETAGVEVQSSWGAREHNIQDRHQAALSQGFIEPLECNNTLQLGSNCSYNPATRDQLNVANSTRSTNGIIPGWML